MSEQIMQLSTFEIEPGKLDAFKSSIENAVTFAEENGSQLLVEVYIDEENMQAHSCQIQPDFNFCEQISRFGATNFGNITISKI